MVFCDSSQNGLNCGLGQKGNYKVCQRGLKRINSDTIIFMAASHPKLISQLIF